MLALAALGLLPVPRLASHADTTPTRSHRPRVGLPRMAEPEYFFSQTDDKKSISFGCRQRSVIMVKPEPAGTLHSFVTGSPQDVLLSSWPAGRVRQTADDRFSIKVEEFSFVTLTIAVELDVRCWLQNGAACVESGGFRIVGLEGLADVDRFDIQVRGRLKPSPPDSTMCLLTGDVEFEATGPLPALMQATPEPVLRAAARAVSAALNGAASDRFAKQVPAAYSEWARAQKVAA
tara:strand:- start:762 stop:1463 length:702 start_codon:yes stop_codon:yes gene_type:complete